MFGISFPELLVIVALAFLIIGPQKLAGSFHTLGTWVRKTRDQWEILKQTRLSDIDTTTLYETKIELNRTLDEIRKSPPPSAERPSGKEDVPKDQEGT